MKMSYVSILKFERPPPSFSLLILYKEYGYILNNSNLTLKMIPSFINPSLLFIIQKYTKVWGGGGSIG